MALSFTTQDIYALMGELAAQATGQKSIAVFDTDSFVSAGELTMATGTENVLNSLSLIIGKTLVAVRPYQARLSDINVLDNGLFSSRIRKISFYSNKPLPSGAFNTNLYTNFYPAYDNQENGATGSTPATNSTKSMWEQNYQFPLELNFHSNDTYQMCITIPEIQLQTAFRDEASFGQFISGMLTQHGNDLELAREQFARMTLLARMGYSLAISDASSNIKALDCAIDLKAAYNAEFGLTGASAKSTADLLTTDLKSFAEFVAYYIRTLSDKMTYPSTKYFAAPIKTVNSEAHVILRHTPKSEQRLKFFNPLWNKIKTMVMPEIFNPQYLSIDNFEAVDFWQSFATPAEINLKVTVPGWLESMITNGSTTSDTSYTANVPYVVGVLYDRDSVMTQFEYESSTTTPVEARKHYRNQWYTFEKGAICDPTERFVVLYLSADPTNDAKEEETKKSSKK